MVVAVDWCFVDDDVDDENANANDDDDENNFHLLVGKLSVSSLGSKALIHQKRFRLDFDFD